MVGAAADAGRALPAVQEVLGSRGTQRTHKTLLQVLLPSSAEPSWPAGSRTGIVGNKRMFFSIKKIFFSIKRFFFSIKGFFFSLLEADLVEQRAELSVLQTKVEEERRGERGQLK